MKIPASSAVRRSVAAGSRWAGRRREAAFTMVEIAICIGVVAFALVAIIGVLPTGFEVQQKNRENTIISQEGNFWLEAIRGGALGLDYLTNNVDMIAVPPTRVFSATNGFRSFRSGREIIGLLTQPARVQGFRLLRVPVTAYVRALTGPAGEKTPKNDFAFTYRLTSEVVPYSAMARPETNWHEAGISTNLMLYRAGLWAKSQVMATTTYELSLTLEWPVYTANKQIRVGNNRKVFRALVNGVIASTNDSRLGDRYWLRSLEFLNQP